jgi:hypothetical protein
MILRGVIKFFGEYSFVITCLFLDVVSEEYFPNDDYFREDNFLVNMAINEDIFKGSSSNTLSMLSLSRRLTIVWNLASH